MIISQLKILKGVPFNADSKIVITFNSYDSQYNFFNRYTIADYRNTTFIKGFFYKKIKIDIDFEEIKYANYILFKNTDEENDRWNYAYITNIEYISENCTYIEIEMDYFQTYLGDIIFGECKMERMMTDLDEIDYSLVTEEEPELLVDNYLITGHDEINFNIWKVCVCYKPNLIVESMKDVTNIIGQQLSGNNQLNYRDYTTGQYSQYFNRGGAITDTYMTGCAYRVYDISDSNDLENITNDLWKLETLGYSILNIYMIPSEFRTNDGVYEKTIELDGAKSPYRKSDKKIYIDTDGYTPINKKCYTYPYMYLELSNKQGDSKIYKYEYLGNENNTTFKMLGTFYNKAEAVVYPTIYKCANIISNRSVMYDYGVSIKEMPECQWNTPAQATRAGIGLISDAVMAVATGGASLPFTAGKLATGAVKTATDPSTKGMSAMPILQALFDVVGWTFRQYTTFQIKEIDDYFSQFGYSITATLKPNILGNRRFNYVKTKNAVVRGNIPIYARKQIIDKLNDGITFWHDLQNFDYGNFRGIYSNDITGDELTNEGKIF